MNKAKVTYRKDSPIRQKIYYDVMKIELSTEVVVIYYFDHVRGIEMSAIIHDYFEIKIF